MQVFDLVIAAGVGIEQMIRRGGKIQIPDAPAVPLQACAVEVQPVGYRVGVGAVQVNDLAGRIRVQRYISTGGCNGRLKIRPGADDIGVCLCARADHASSPSSGKIRYRVPVSGVSASYSAWVSPCMRPSRAAIRSPRSVSASAAARCSSSAIACSSFSAS